MASVIVSISCESSDQAADVATAVREAGVLEVTDTEMGTTAHLRVGDVFVGP
jgi:hypothetical protein